MTLGEALASRRVLVADGAMGSLGLAYGLSGPSAQWTLDAPSEVERIHRAYVDAGAEIIATNTFAASESWVAPGTDLDRICREAAHIARHAAAGRAWVVGDIGPCGLGSSEGAEASRRYRSRAVALVDASVDGLLLETFSSLEDLRVAAEACRSASPDVTLLACATKTSVDDRLQTSFVGELAALGRELGLAGIGFNCGDGAAPIVALVDALAAETHLPIIAKPSAGLPTVSAGTVVYDVGPQEFAQRAKALVGAGATVLGGCCGTTPATIRALAKAVQALGGEPETVENSFGLF